MARIFLDVNYLIALLGLRKDFHLPSLTGHNLFISPLSVHILFYAYKMKVPNVKFDKLIQELNIVSLTEDLLAKSLIGPNSDLEDNIQLHSASEADCEFILSQDKSLLKMKFFGKSAILSAI